MLLFSVFSIQFIQFSVFRSFQYAGCIDITEGLVLNGHMPKPVDLKLKEGDKAPDFTAASSGGGKVSLSDFKGKNVILYFYPKDDTPGCTKEACAFRDDFSEFENAGAVVLGVSTDPVKKHDKFVQKYNLPFTLVADEDKKIVNAYGVWGERSFMGIQYMGTARVTFLIEPDGRIRKIWPAVKPAQHAKEILQELRSNK